MDICDDDAALVFFFEMEWELLRVRMNVCITTELIDECFTNELGEIYKSCLVNEERRKREKINTQTEKKRQNMQIHHHRRDKNGLEWSSSYGKSL